MSMRVQSGVRSPALLATQPSKLTPATRKRGFKGELVRYQGSRRCRPGRDFGAGLAGGAGVGAAGGALVGAVALGVPLLPVFGLGIITGALGAIAGGVVGGAVGGVVGGVGGGITAATHAHIHAPERGKLRKHVFSQFGVVPMRHQSARIVKQLEAEGVLSSGSRRVRHSGRIDRALGDVRVFGKPLTPEQKQSIKKIVQLQAAQG